MPFITDRARQLKDLEGQFIVSLLVQPPRHFTGESSSSAGTDTSSSDREEESSSSDSDLDMLEGDQDSPTVICELLSAASGIRYFEGRKTFLKSREFANEYFANLPDDYFRNITRMDKVSFWTLHGMIEEHRVFFSKSPRKQYAVSLQLAVTLDRLGHHGNGACLKRTCLLWGISTGSVIKFMHRCMSAMELALVDAVTWPDRDERARISSEFAKKGFSGCVGLVDGTTLPLSQRPKMEGQVYFDRKKRYSINMQVICDDQRRILHIFAGMPGSCSDVLCIQRAPFWSFRDHPDTFSNNEYLLGDSGYPGLPHIVAAFKNGIAAKDPKKGDFNFCIAKTRILNEHCIGVLKSRWHSLKEQKTELKEGPTTTEWMMRQIECCVRLHNFVLDLQDDWREEDWEEGLWRQDQDEACLDHEDDIVEESHFAPIPTQNIVDFRKAVMEKCLAFNTLPGGLLA